MAKKIYYESTAREKVLSGAKQLYDAVKVTFGPKGKNVIIEKEYGAPVITHDGVTVAEAVDLPSNEDNLGEAVGAKLIKTAAQKLNKAAGDGTTTVTVLTYNILREANKLIAAGVNPMELRAGIEKAGTEIVAEIEKTAEKIEGDDKKVAEVATISAGDAEIGELIAEVISKIGKDGVVTVEAGQGLEMEEEIVEGFSYDKGYSSPFFVTDVNRQEAVFEKPLILITDKKISAGADILPLLEKVIATKSETTIIKGTGDAKAVAKRIDLIWNQAEAANSDYEREELEKRAAALSGKVAVIKVGGATETEIDEKKFRVDDAVAATKAALAEGIVPGGGVTLVNAVKKLNDEDAGVKIVKNALKAPFVHIMENAGLNSQALLAEVEKAKDGFGVNVMNPEKGLIDLKKNGVVDPAKVTKEAVLNATSIAGTAITMGALIVNIPEEKPAAPEMGGGVY